jgi:competence protein ComEC
MRSGKGLSFASANESQPVGQRGQMQVLSHATPKGYNVQDFHGHEVLVLMRTVVLTILLLALSVPIRAQKALTVYFIDVEGGQATLFVSPSGQSMLVDTGWAGNQGRDAQRILEVAKQAGLHQIDDLVITHYHADHVGGVPQLAVRIPIRNFVDHGPSVEHGPEADELYHAYLQVRAKGLHILATPGEVLPIQGIRVQVLTAAGKEIANPLPGAGAPNPFCKGVTRRQYDPTENAQSVGMLITCGKFRMLDLGDLTWNKEMDLVCPENKIGTVEVYLSTHHGLNLSNCPAIVHALHPIVAIMNNGATKGGSREAWKTIHTSPGLEDLWQLHYAEASGKAYNVSRPFIANLSPTSDGHYIKLTAYPDGTFTVLNSRNNKSKTYRP